MPDWLVSGFAVAAFLTLLAWAGRIWIAETLVQSVRHDFNSRLESLRADMRARESEIHSLRESALSNMRGLQAATLQRRVQAVDDLWSAVTDYNRLTSTLLVMSLIKFDGVMDQIEKDEKVRRWANALVQDTPQDFSAFGPRANSARPYLSDLAWALFSAYQMMFLWAATQANVFRIGIDARPFFNAKGLDDILVKALPDMRDYIASAGSAGHVHLAEILRNRILAELRAVLEGREQDAASIARAAEVLSAVEAAHKARSEMEANAQRP